MKIELWLNECYGCDRKGKFDPLHRFILDNNIPLGNFIVKRTILKPEWQKEAEQSGVELPALKIIGEKGVEIVNYKEWLANKDTQVVQLKKTRKKTASIKKKEVKTTEEK